MPIVFKKSVDRLNPEDKKEFEKEYHRYYTDPLTHKYYSRLFGNYKFDFKNIDEYSNDEFIIQRKDIEGYSKLDDDFEKQLKEDLKENNMIDGFNKEANNNKSIEVEDIIDTTMKK